MYNTDSTIGENIRYFTYKYDLLYDDWFRDLNSVKPVTVGSLNLLVTTRLVN